MGFADAGVEFQRFPRLGGGFLFVAVNTDVALLARQTEALVKAFKPA